MATERRIDPMNGEPYYFTLGVPDVERAMAFYAGLFGWRFTADGHITNLALSGGVAPAASSGLGSRLFLTHGDVPAGVATVRALGGSSAGPVTSRSGDHAECVDDQGTAFNIGWVHPELEAEQIAGLGELPRPSGVLGYLTLGVPDVDRAAAFYHGLFGWHAEPATPSAAGGGASYRHVTSTALPLGLADHHLDDRLHLYFRVDDAAAATARVGDLGGRPGDLGASETGLSTLCHDDQGLVFGLWQPAPDL
jgi:uncharacterized protein